MMTQHAWHYVKKGILGDETLGPFDEAGFIAMVERGELKPATLVSSTRNGGQWVELQTVPGLMKALRYGDECRKAAAQGEAEVRNRDREAQRQAAAAEAEQLRQAEETRRAAAAEAKRLENEKAARFQADLARREQPQAPVAAVNWGTVIAFVFGQIVLLGLAAIFTLAGLVMLVERMAISFNPENAIGYTANQLGWATPALWFICALLICIVSSLERLMRTR